MSLVNFIKRKIARVLEPFPRIRKSVRAIAIVANRLLSKKGEEHIIDEKFQLKSLDEFLPEEIKSREYFFGYFDKSPWSPDGNQLIIHAIDDKEGNADIVLIDIPSGESKIVATTQAWNHQQGAMTTWISNTEIIYNDISNANLISIRLNLKEGSKSTMPFPIQCFSVDRNEILSLNYKKLLKLRPDYGYTAHFTNFHEDQPLDEDGVWRMNLETGESELLINLKQLANTDTVSSMNGANHKVNHFVYSPKGKRFIFMHRWLSSTGKYSRLYVYDFETSQLKILLDCRMISHYNWRDEETIIAYARTNEEGDRYYEINTTSGNVEVVGKGIMEMYGDGHPSYSPDKQRIVSDSYPDTNRYQHLFVWDVKKQSRIEIGAFYSPWEFINEERCDLHPRWNNDGTIISIDSAMSGKRKMYLIDVSSID